VYSSCWFVDFHCRWFQFSSEEPVLTEISTVTGANNLIVLEVYKQNKPKTGIRVQGGWGFGPSYNLYINSSEFLVKSNPRWWFSVVYSSCWFVDFHCRWFQFSSEEPVLTEISTVTGANNLIVLGLRRWEC
jgi:hypothetical protein